MQLQEHISSSATHLEKFGTEFYRSLVFKESFPGFDGHFPGNPILPGVIQTMIGQISAMEVLEEKYPAEKLTLHSVTRCKFLRPVKPLEKLDLTFSLKTKGLKHIAICRLTVDGVTAATYQLIFAPEAV